MGFSARSTETHMYFSTSVYGCCLEHFFDMSCISIVLAIKPKFARLAALCTKFHQNQS